MPDANGNLTVDDIIAGNPAGLAPSSPPPGPVGSIPPIPPAPSSASGGTTAVPPSAPLPSTGGGPLGSVLTGPGDQPPRTAPNVQNIDPLGPMRWYQKLGQGFGQGWGYEPGVTPAPASKLGKLFAILHGAAIGAAAASGQPNWGAGVMASQQALDQQQNQAIQQAQARQNLAYLPLQRAWQLKQMQDQEDLRRAQMEYYGARSQAAETQAARPGPLKQVGNRMVAWNPGTKAYEDVGPVGQTKPYTKVMGDRTMQWNAGTNDWQDVGQAPTKQTSPFGKIAPEIYGQIGDMPTDSQYRGQDYGTVEAARAQWGKDYQRIKSQEAIAPAMARGQAYGYYRPYNAIDAEGNAHVMWAGDAVKQGFAPAELGTKIMGKEAQFQDIKFASDRLRNALNNLDAQFSPTQIAELTAAMNHEDPGIRNNLIAGLVSQQLTEPQRDFVTWANQLNERAMSLRNLAGMGQGAQDLRAAVMNTLPSMRSGDRAMALKQLDAFDNLTDNLYKGVPKIKGGLRGNTNTQAPAPAKRPPLSSFERPATR